MKIGIEATSAFEPHKAGVGYYTYHLIRAMLQLPEAAHAYTLYARHASPSVQRAFDLEASPSAQVHLRALSCPYLWAQVRLPFELWQHKQDAYFFPSAVLPLLYQPKNSVITVHDIAFLFFPDCFAPALRSWLNIATEHGIRRARKVIAVSEATRQDILAYYTVNPDDVVTVHHGARDIFQPLERRAIDSVKARYHLNAPYILCIGTLQRRKNIPRLLHAFYLLKQKHHIPHKLVLIGQRHPDLPESEIAATLDRLSLEQEVIWTGYMRQEDMPALLNGADVFVLPSLYEGFGMPLLEAMACGIPVACSNTSSLPEVVGDAGMLFDPYSVDRIAETIYALVSDSRQRQALREKGLERVKLFSWTTCARKTLHVLKTAKI